MISTCLNGQSGPERHYPGFGGQGSALAGFNHLTGWPDREPVGPHGTITDSLAPRFVATALAAGLLYRRRTGRGIYLDVSQVEAAIVSVLDRQKLLSDRTGVPEKVARALGAAQLAEIGRLLLELASRFQAPVQRTSDVVGA